MAAVKQNGMVLKDLDECLKNDPDVVLEAVKQNKHAFSCSGLKLEDDLRILMEMLKYDGMLLGSISEELRRDKHLISLAVSQNGMALQFALLDDNSQDCQNICFIAVKQNSMALQFVSEDLKNNPEMVLEAVRLNGMALQFASDALKDNPEIVLEAVRQNEMALGVASERLRADETITMTSIIRSEVPFRFFSGEAVENPNRVLAAARLNPGIIPLIQQPSLKILIDKVMQLSGCDDYENSLISEKEMILSLITEDERSFKYVPAFFRSDKVFMKEVLNINGMFFGYNSYGYNSNYKFNKFRGAVDVALVAVRQNGMALQFASPIVQNTIQVVYTAVKQNGMALQFASEKLKGDKELVLAAISQNKAAFDFVSDSLKEDPDILSELKK